MAEEGFLAAKISPWSFLLRGGELMCTALLPIATSNYSCKIVTIQILQLGSRHRLLRHCPTAPNKM